MEHHCELYLYSPQTTLFQHLNPKWITAGNLTLVVGQQRKRARRCFQRQNQELNFFRPPTSIKSRASHWGWERLDWRHSTEWLQGPVPHNTDAHNKKAAEIKGILVLLWTIVSKSFFLNPSQWSLPKEMSETEWEKLVHPCPTTRPCLPDHHPSFFSTLSIFSYFSHHYSGNFNFKPWRP